MGIETIKKSAMASLRKFSKSVMFGRRETMIAFNTEEHKWMDREELKRILMIKRTTGKKEESFLVYIIFIIIYNKYLISVIFRKFHN